MITSNDSFLRGLEKRVIDRLCGLVPPFIGTKALTFMSLASSALVFASYYLSTKIRIFLFAASLFVVAQWAFDCLDGAIGRARKEGFLRWGFYMDHLFDYFFMIAILLGFWAIFPDARLQIVLLLLFISSFMVNFFLLFSVIRDKEPDFVISFGHFSPIEFRLLIILFNTALFFFESGVRYVVSRYLFVLNMFLFIMLIVVIHATQKRLSAYDLTEKR